MSSSACCVQTLRGPAPLQYVLYLPNCNTVAIGELCEGEGECGTTNSLNNCQTWDVYTRITCPSPPPPPNLPPVPSPPPVPPPVNCPGNWSTTSAARMQLDLRRPTPCAPCTVSRGASVPSRRPCGTTAWAPAATDQCTGVVTSAANANFYFEHRAPRTCVGGARPSTRRATSTRAWLPAMFTSNRADRCNACNNFNILPPPPPPTHRHHPRRRQGATFFFGGLSSLNPGRCHAIAVYNRPLACHVASTTNAWTAAWAWSRRTQLYPRA